MNRYFLPKTGWEFFDISRAYGLGVIVHALSGNAVVSDMGGFYLIESREKLDFERLEQIYLFLSDTQAWNWTLQTLTGKDKKTGKEKREIKKMEVIAFLTDVSQIKILLKSFEDLRTPPIIGEGNETLYQAIDLAATKGIRDAVLKSYSEKKGKKEPRAYSDGLNV